MIRKGMVIPLLLLSFVRLNAQERNVESLSNTVLLTLTGGYSFGYQALLSEHSSLRWDVNLSYSSDARDRDENASSYSYSYQNPLNLTASTGESKGESYSISFSPGYFLNSPASKIVTGYLGAGPVVGYSGSWSRYAYSDSPRDTIQQHSHSSNHQHDFSAGLQLTAGLRCMVSSSFSFFAEVQARCTYNWAVISNASSTTNFFTTGGLPRLQSESRSERTETGLDVGIGGVRLGVAFSF